MRADAGVVISASHNPYQDNGIKIFGPDGFKLPDEEEARDRAAHRGHELDRGARHRATRVGTAERIDDAPGRYVVFLKNTFPPNLTLDGMRIVVDAAHGAAYSVAPAVFGELGADVTASASSPNGKNINHKRGALHPEHVRSEVERARARDLGIALDGDADRVIIVDEKGHVVDGDAVMALCAHAHARARAHAARRPSSPR